MPSVITSQRLLQEAYNLLGNTHFAVPRDAEVVCPDEDWFREKFIPQLDAVTKPYIAGSYDCEDFTAEAWVLMSRCIRVTPEYHGKGHSLGYTEGHIPAGRELNGVRDGVHATNIIRFSNGIWAFFEPQPSNKRLTLVELAANVDFFPRDTRL